MGAISDLKQMRRLVARKKANLERDKLYVRERAYLVYHLDKAHTLRPVALNLFFKTFPNLIKSKLPFLRDFVASIDDSALQKLLLRYVRYCLRFGVTFKYHPKRKPYFTVQFEVPYSEILHVRLVGDSIRPVSAQTGLDEPYDYFFESRTIVTPSALARCIRAGSMRYVIIEDRRNDSILSKLEEIAEHPDGITVLLHRLEHPKLFCLVGERVDAKMWEKAYPVLRQLIEENLHRTTSGRPADLKKFNKGVRLRKKPGPLKEKAPELIEKASKIEVGQVALSRIAQTVKTGSES